MSVECNFESWKRQGRKHFDDKEAAFGGPAKFRVFHGAQMRLETPERRVIIEHALLRPVCWLNAPADERDQRTRDSIDRPATRCIWDDGWLVERDEAGVA